MKIKTKINNVLFAYLNNIDKYNKVCNILKDFIIINYKINDKLCLNIKLNKEQTTLVYIDHNNIYYNNNIININ